MNYKEIKQLAENINLLCGNLAQPTSLENNSNSDIEPSEDAAATIICIKKSEDQETYGDQLECRFINFSSCPNDVSFEALIHVADFD